MTSPRGGRHEYRNASDYRSCLDIARWWWVVREGSLVLTAYVGSTASDDRAAARGGKQFSGYHSTCRSPKPDRQNDLDFQQPGRNNQPTCPRFDVRWTMSSFCNERQLGRLLKKYLAYYRGSGALVCKRTQGVCGPGYGRWHAAPHKLLVHPYSLTPWRCRHACRSENRCCSQACCTTQRRRSELMSFPRPRLAAPASPATAPPPA